MGKTIIDRDKLHHEAFFQASGNRAAENLFCCYFFKELQEKGISRLSINAKLAIACMDFYEEIEELDAYKKMFYNFLCPDAFTGQLLKFIARLKEFSHLCNIFKEDMVFFRNEVCIPVENEEIYLLAKKLVEKICQYRKK